MTFQEWWVEYRGFDDPYDKDGMRDAWNAAIEKSAKACLKEADDPHNLPAKIVARRCADTISDMKEPKP